jgi:hypothetical protein
LLVAVGALGGGRDAAPRQIEHAIDRRRQILGVMRGAHQRELPSQPLDHHRELIAGARIEPARRLIEQQHRRPEGHAARDQHSSLLASGQGQERPLAEVSDAEPIEDRERVLALGVPRRSARHVGPIHARQHHFERGEVPAEARVAILKLVAHQHDFASRLHGVALRSPAEVVAALAAARCGPSRARDQTEERSLAAAVRADDAPMLVSLEAPVERVEHGRPVDFHVDLLEPHQGRESHDLPPSAALVTLRECT